MRPEKILICFFREAQKYSSSSVRRGSARKVRCARNAQRATRLFLYHLELQLLSSRVDRGERRERTLSLSLSLSALKSQTKLPLLPSSWCECAFGV